MKAARHITRDYRNTSGKGGRALEYVTPDGECDHWAIANDGAAEGTLRHTLNGWYQRQGEYWAPIYPPHEEGAVEALSAALAGNLPCKPAAYGSGCPGVDPDVAQIVDDLCEAGWRLTRTDPAL